MTDLAGMYYKGTASPLDRFFGAPCGCVFIVKNYELHLAAGRQAQAETFLDCFTHHELSFVKIVTERVAQVPMFTSSLYHFAPPAQEHGYRWQ